MMSEQDKLLDQQIHDAFEGVELGAAAQERMLSRLLDAQAQRAETSGDDAGVKPEASGAADDRQRRPRAAHLKVQVEPARRRVTWKVLLPLAAVLAVAAIVVRLQTGASSQVMDLKESVVPLAGKSVTTEEAAGAATEDVASDEAYAEGASQPEEPAAEEESLESLDAPLDPEMADSGGTPGSAAGLYPKVTLADGTVLSALVDGLHAEPVDAARVGKELGAAKATPFDADDSVDCTVFALTDDSEGFAVRYEGEQGFWYASRL